MIITFGNNALEVHKPFHESRARERCLFGAVGSGKSYAICDEAIGWCLEQPGIRGLITRKTIPELRDTTEQVFAERMPPDLWAAGHCSRTGGHFDTFTFPNGSQILFRSIDDWHKHKSLNLGFIAWDEWGEFDEDTVIGMQTRLRQVDLTPEARKLGYTGKITRTGMWGATNPEGKDWIYYRYHPSSPKRRQDSEAFFSRSIDNPYLSTQYLEDLMTMPEPYIKRYVLCQFDDFAGRCYEDWGWESHTVPPPKWSEMGIDRPLVWMGMDPGTQNPTAGLWCWVDSDNRRLVGIAEYQHPALAVDEHAKAWRQIEASQRMNVRWRVADPNSITQRDRGSVISLATQYAKQGFTFQLGASSPNDRVPALAHLIHLRRFVVSRACLRTFESIKDRQWKDLTPAQRSRGEDPKQELLPKNDHLAACAEYLAGRESPVTPLHRRRTPAQLYDEYPGRFDPENILGERGQGIGLSRGTVRDINKNIRKQMRRRNDLRRHAPMRNDLNMPV